MERLRALALEGLAVTPVTPPPRVRKRRREEGGCPPTPPGAAALAREPMPEVLRDGAELEWRRAAQTWTPPIGKLVAQGVVSVTVRGRDVDAAMRNGTQRARGLPPPWVAVVVALLTGRELPAVRRALKRGVNLFVPEAEKDGAP